MEKGAPCSVLSLVLDLIPYVVFWKDRSSAYLGCNRHFASVAGLTAPEAIVGLTDYDLPWTKAESDAYRADDAAVMSSGEAKLHIVETLLDANGNEKWLDTSKVPLRNRENEVIGVLGVFVDITELKHAEAKLQRTRQHLEDAIEAIDAGLVMYDSSDRLVFCNERYRRLYRDAEVMLVPGTRYEDVVSYFAAQRYDPVDAMPNGAWARDRIAQRRKGGRSELRVDDRVILVSDRPTRDHGIVSLHTDVTADKQREHELRRVKELAVAASTAKTNFMANLSHEIRTPMSAILGFTELLTKSAREDQISGLETIQRNANHLLELIDDILDLSKIEAGKLRVDQDPTDAIAIVRDVTTLMTQRAVGKGLRFDLRLGGRLPKSVASDATRLRQILINLIGNAIKFTIDGAITMTVDTTGTSLRVAVADTGVGIAETDFERIFEPFEQGDASTTRRHGGVGLGLAISRQLARALGGDIVVTSQRGHGSTFTLTHPLPDHVEWIDTERTDAAAGPAHPRTAATGLPSLRGRTVLVVEDGADNRVVFGRFLEAAGGKVLFATDGVEALERVAEANRDRTTIDAILMDMQMPLLDGYEATRRLREQGCRIPIVALTAHAMSGDRQRCTDAGCDDYLTKPASGRHLLEVVAAWIERGAPSPQIRDR